MNQHDFYDAMIDDFWLLYWFSRVYRNTPVYSIWN